MEPQCRCLNLRRQPLSFKAAANDEERLNGRVIRRLRYLCGRVVLSLLVAQFFVAAIVILLVGVHWLTYDMIPLLLLIGSGSDVLALTVVRHLFPQSFDRQIGSPVARSSVHAR